MSGNDVLTALIVALLGSSGIVGLVSFAARWKPERTNLIVDAAKGAVVVQGDVIEDLHQQLADMRARLAEQSALIEAQTAQIEQLQREVHALTDSLDAAVRERDELKAKLVPAPEG